MEIGIDVVKIERIRSAIKSQHFLRRVFTDAERQYASTKSDSAATLAGIFAAKEASFKAAGRFFKGLNLLDITVSHSSAGVPYSTVNGRKIKLSITHEGSYAVAAALFDDDLPAESKDGIAGDVAAKISAGIKKEDNIQRKS